MGIPTQWSNYIVTTVLGLLPLIFLLPMLLSLRGRAQLRPRQSIALWRQSLCILLAFMMFAEPVGLIQQAYASIDPGNAVFYTYDDNGSLIKKIIADKDETDPDNNFTEKTLYTYNLQNRLAEVKVTTDGTNWDVTTYKYNPEGIRVEKNGNGTVTSYLVDSYNHTGYAQVFVEDDGTDTTSYIIGNDVLAQATNSDTPKYLLYDGQGSVRQIADSDGMVADGQSHYYDAYGNFIEGWSDPPQSNLRYTGQQWDESAQMYYLRARWYNPSNGLFNRIDDYSGNYSDPQSLHKYMYASCNPVMYSDPSGNTTISTQEVSVTTLTGAEIYALSLAADLLIARTVVEELTSPSAIAESLRVPIIPLTKVEPKTSDKGYVYFVHGTHTFDWLFRHEVRGDIGGQQRDFGRGFYTFKLSDPGSLKAASQFAEMVSASRGLGFSSPILIIVRFHRATYNNLNKKDLKSNPVEWGRWVNDFWKGKRFAPTGYDEIYGPESTRTKRSFIPNWDIPIQHKFEQSGISKGMEVVGVVPVPCPRLLAGQ